MGGGVYFVRGADTGRVKIGRATDPARRVATLQTGSAERLVLVKVIRTTDPVGLERELHQRFAEDRLGGEWFLPSPELDQLCGSPRPTSEERRRLADSAQRKVDALLAGR